MFVVSRMVLRSPTLRMIQNKFASYYTGGFEETCPVCKLGADFDAVGDVFQDAGDGAADSAGVVVHYPGHFAFGLPPGEWTMS